MPIIEAAVAACPECEAEVKVSDGVQQSEIVQCPDCNAELEVVGLAPLMLALAPEPEEDWGE